MKKVVASIFFILVSGFLVFAQDGYRLIIRQVYPANKEVYKNTFNFKRELDNAISSQSAKYRGNNNNYTLIINTPSGKETRYIQNITWIQTINGVTTPHKSKTKPAESYPKPTIWTGTACNIDGSPKGESITYEFIYKVSNGDADGSFTEYLTKDSAVFQAQRLYDENLVEGKLVQFTVYAFKEESPELVKNYSNKTRYQEILAARMIEQVESEEDYLRDSLATSVNGFKTRMNELISARDSLGAKGIRQCRIALETACETIPDSLFLKEGLDVTYRLAVSQYYQKINFFKKNKRTKRLQEIIVNQNTSRDSLLLYTKQLEMIVLSGDKK